MHERAFRLGSSETAGVTRVIRQAGGIRNIPGGIRNIPQAGANGACGF